MGVFFEGYITTLENTPTRLFVEPLEFIIASFPDLPRNEAKFYRPWAYF